MPCASSTPALARIFWLELPAASLAMLRYQSALAWSSLVEGCAGAAPVVSGHLLWPPVAPGSPPAGPLVGVTSGGPPCWEAAPGAAPGGCSGAASCGPVGPLLPDEPSGCGVSSG